MQHNEDEIGKIFRFNSMACEELISNFVNFSLEIGKYLSIEPTGIIYKIRIFNPKRKQLVLVSTGTFRDSLGRLMLDLADREVFLANEDLKPEKIAYAIWAEFNYLFGISEDHFIYTNREGKLMNFEQFAEKR